MEAGHIEIKSGTPRGFGFVFAAVFAIIGLYPVVHDEEWRWWALLLAGIFFALALIRPSLLEKPNQWWFRFGLFLGGIVAPIVMGLVYIVAILPMNIFVRLSGKDLMALKMDKNTDSYWVVRNGHQQNMNNQF